MRGVILFLLIIMIPVVTAFEQNETEMTGNYSIIVEDNGNALVSLGIQGSGTINLNLPLDVVSPVVNGALYIQAPNGIDISVGTSRKARVVYQTSLLTTKPSESWTFEMEIPEFTSSSVFITFPENIEIVQTTPTALISHTDDATELIWNLDPQMDDTLKLQYRFVKHTPRASQVPVVLVDEMPDIPGDPTIEHTANYKSIQYSFGFLLVVLMALSYYTYQSKSRHSSKGMEDVMKTLTENEKYIVETLLENNGEMKRNKLEKTSGLAKSSLASTLYRLEERNILNVDKSGVIHYVWLTDWFKSL